MGLITKEVYVKWNPKYKKYYESKGYIFTKMKDSFLVNTNDLPNYCNYKVDVKCDNCGLIKSMTWVNYILCRKEENLYLCAKCVKSLISEKRRMETKLKNGKSFEQWCLENNRINILGRWDYDLNKLKPNEILFSSSKDIYFKCPSGLHKSEIKSINDFVNGQEGSINCNACNSFAQIGINKFGKDFIDKYWDNKNILNPWKISYASKNMVWIKCQEYEIHGSYKISCNNFSLNNNRCPKCNISKGENEIKFILDKLNINYIQQKTFKNLLGVKCGNLSYDFYLPNYNILIEYQGQFHDGNNPLQKKHQLEIQKEHDKRKREYAIDNKIKLIEIWYYDFNKIEEILKDEFNKY